METRIIYITCHDRSEAREIGATLVREKLAACTNLLPGMESCYEWNGEIQQDEEVVLIAKTTADRVAELTTRVLALHSYDLPAILSLTVDGGNPDYLDWVAKMVKSQ